MGRRENDRSLTPRLQYKINEYPNLDLQKRCTVLCDEFLLTNLMEKKLIH